MADTKTTDSSMEGGSYEVIRARLLKHADELGARADALNKQRRELFGGQELTVIGNERARTEHNCVPRDIAAMGPHLLLGFNVFMGLKKETHVSDVFTLLRLQQADGGGFEFEPVPADQGGGFLADRRFVKEFTELYQYYKDTRFTQLQLSGTRLLALFQTGQTERDLKVFRFGVDSEGRCTYLDNRGESELTTPPSHDFEWTRATRDNFVAGRHPHVNILDEVFVETVGGDLTVKVENNTEDGQGIYREPVDDGSQSLDDAEFHYAKVGPLVLLKILPFRESAYRYLVFNARTREVVRIDAVGRACRMLPEDQGVIFPGGYYLATGDYKVFDGDVSGLEFKRAIQSPNGEDVLYVFYRGSDGFYFLLPYNLVRREVSNPIPCHGYSVFADGRMVTFRSTSNEPTRVHPMQIWQTPFVSPEFAAAAPRAQGFLGKVGNAELVRGISDAYTLKRMAQSEKPTRRTFEDLIAAATRAIDSYSWLGHQDVGLAQHVLDLRKTAELIIDEFEKVIALQKRAAQAMAEAEAKQAQVLGGLIPDSLSSVDGFMSALTQIRTQRGHLISLKEIRYIDAGRIGALEEAAVRAFEDVSKACVDFLLRPDALKPLSSELDSLLTRLEPVTRTADLLPLVEQAEATSRGLELLGEVVGGLQVGDPAARATILESISEVFAKSNRVRATVQNRRKELLGKERRAEFGAQFKLLSQSIESALTVADAPEKCDEQLARLSVQLEELEGRFSEFDEFISQLAEKREELYEAFGAKKQALVEERQKRAANLLSAADRILQGLQRRAKTFNGEDELNAYYASDAMVQKLRQISEQLLSLGDSVKADELDSRLKQSKQDALRALRDKKDLFEGGTAVIKLGANRFNVNTQPLELTLLPRDGHLSIHLTGTDFHQRVEDPQMEQFKPFWEQALPSESADVARIEYLAGCILFDAEEGKSGLSLERLYDATRTQDGLLSLVRAYAAERYEDGYERGVHDADAAALLDKLLSLRQGAGLLRFAPAARAWASLYWAEGADENERRLSPVRARALAKLRESFPGNAEILKLGSELAGRIELFLKSAHLPFEAKDVELAGRYLAEELCADRPRFVLSGEAAELADALLKKLDARNQLTGFRDALRSLSKNLTERMQLAIAYVDALLASDAQLSSTLGPARLEAAVQLVTEGKVDHDASHAPVAAEVSGLLSQHARIQGQKLHVRLDEFTTRLSEYRARRIPEFQRYRGKVRQLLEHKRKAMRLDELSPRVLSSFVRNKLIDEVYLPLIGTNLAKQLGTAGENKRTDRMGMLLLISPPGYGKTTLMEYVASRLGLAFVKVNGPALGHDVTSLDPADAPNATARQEVERINLSFEMGNNVMLYLDDIQHTNPELLQKFISLCDGTRRVEGVWNGGTRTYDLRGKKFCVVMAGNPYTESGDRFQIPDMLANRADTYNLGDVLSGKEDLFALSYLENALTSNPVLQPLATRPSGDIYRLIKMAKGEEVPTAELEHGYSGVELQEITAIFKRLFFIQRVLLKVNLQYIASASQDDKFRTEPPFKLQGSYRNMNKMAEKVVAAMTDDELEKLIDAHYAGEAQTLTTSAEQNLLKLAELRGRMSALQDLRWKEIKKGFQRVQTMGGKEDDPVTRVTGTLSALQTELGGIREAVLEAAKGVEAGDLKAQLDAAMRDKQLALQRADQLQALMRAQPQQAAAAPSPIDAQLAREVTARLDQLREAILAVAKAASENKPAAVTPAPGVDLRPYLEKLGETLKAVAEKQPPPPPPKQHGKKLGNAPAEISAQLKLVHAALEPLALLARKNIQDGDETVKAVQVWKQVSEAIDLLNAVRRQE